jgi:hypothetical protein
MHKNDHLARTFTALDEAGNEYTVNEYQELVGHCLRTGPTSLRLDDSTPVKRIDEVTLKIVTNDKMLRRLR